MQSCSPEQTLLFCFVLFCPAHRSTGNAALLVFGVPALSLWLQQFDKHEASCVRNPQLQYSTGETAIEIEINYIKLAVGILHQIKHDVTA